MNPIFKPGDKVVVLNHWQEVVSEPVTIETRAYMNGYVYSISELSNTIIPEQNLRFFDPELEDYWDYEEQYLVDERYNEQFEDEEEIKPITLPKKHTTDELLDAYNTLRYLARTLNSEKYELYADQLMTRIKDGERDIDLNEYLLYGEAATEVSE